MVLELADMKAVKTGTVAERLKAVRGVLKLSQRDFSKGVFVAQSYFAEIETGRRAINDRILHLISSIYKVNKEWLKTGKGSMFSMSMTEIKLEQLSGIFSELDELLQDYVIKQTKELLEIQKIKMKNSGTAKN